jgi:uncharacterized membrane protein YdjX (TVP38/TMEM64 family)
MSDSAKRLAWILFVAVLIPIVPFAVIGELPGETWLEAKSGDALLFGATGALLLCGDVLLPIPSSIIGGMLGMQLGFVAGLLWTFLGLTVGSVVAYLLGRLIPEKWSGELEQAPAVSAVFLSRPVPVFAEAMAFAAGATRMGFTAFLASCAMGNFIYAAVMAGSGSTLVPTAMVGPGLFLPMAVPVVTWWLWRRRVRAKPST